MDIPNLIDDLLEDKVDVLERDDGVKIVSVVVLHIVGYEDQLLVLILLKNYTTAINCSIYFCKSISQCQS